MVEYIVALSEEDGHPANHSSQNGSRAEALEMLPIWQSNSDEAQVSGTWCGLEPVVERTYTSAQRLANDCRRIGWQAKGGVLGAIPSPHSVLVPSWHQLDEVVVRER